MQFRRAGLAPAKTSGYICAMSAVTIDRLFVRTLPAAPFLLLAASVGVLGTAYFFEHVLEIYPCQLCLYQRIPWWILSGLACGLIMLRRRPGWMKAVLVLAGLVMATNAVLAGYHVGVEQAWWAGPSSCAGPGGDAMTFEDLKAQILAGPVVRCDKIAWQLFGISMAGFNVALSLGAAGFAILAAGRLPWAQNG